MIYMFIHTNETCKDQLCYTAKKVDLRLTRGDSLNKKLLKKTNKKTYTSAGYPATPAYPVTRELTAQQKGP